MMIIIIILQRMWPNVHYNVHILKKKIKNHFYTFLKFNVKSSCVEIILSDECCSLVTNFGSATDKLRSQFTRKSILFYYVIILQSII